ncbi:MAG TPA: arylsulfotransferase family protein [Solirubrobacteraceae bacterium]|nr:arylsulfotransferase family protein [Solirubrobacteraceae bacterium]
MNILSRRGRHIWMAGALLAWGILAATPASALAGLAKSGAWSLPTQPTLAPPGVDIAASAPQGNPKAGGGLASNAPNQQPGDLFLAPIKNYADSAAFVGKPGPEILEADGTPIWEDPLGQYIKAGGYGRQVVAMDFHTDTYEQRPVLVWWQGYITPNGFGNGDWEIANQHYQVIAQIKPPPGFEMDFHEIQLTGNGMAYIIGTRTVSISLTCCGGPANGSLYDEVVFEVNVKTGAIVWGWDPLQHVRLKESYSGIPKSGPWDPYHLNSISFGPAGAPIISARNTWAAYWVDRSNGRIIATLGGKHSSFRLGPGARFAWQHDVRQQPNEQISIFADEAAPPEGKQSRALLLQLNWAKSSATVLHEYFLPHPALAGSQGNVERESNNNLFVGWGQLPDFSEYAPNGQLLYYGFLPGADESYRTYRAPWIGLPAGSPSVLARASAPGTVTVSASWNGATQIVYWQLLAGTSASALAPFGGRVARSGFETEITTTSRGPYYAVQAIDAAGKVLGTSPAVSANGKPASSPAVYGATIITNARDILRARSARRRHALRSQGRR